MMPRGTRPFALSGAVTFLASAGRCIVLAATLVGLPAIALAQDDAVAGSDAPSSILETYRDWVVRCDRTEGQPRRCEMAQELRQTDGRLVFATLVQRTAAEEATMVFVAPFGVALAEGLRFTWDGAPAWEVPFATCYATGCIAEKAADEADLARLQQSVSVAVAMQAFGGERVDLSVSLAGFSGAWRRLGALAAEQTDP